MVTSWRSLCVIGVLAGLTSAAFAVGLEHPVVHDAATYDAIGWNLAQGHGFSAAAHPPYEPTMFREPLYPAFLSMVYRFAGHRPEVVPYVQLPMFIATCWLTLALGVRLGHPRIGWWAALATACMPVLANYPSYLLTETMFTLFLVASTWAVCRAWSTRQGGWWAAAGVLQGLAALCRGVALPLAGLCSVAALVAPDPSYPRRQRARHVAVSLLLCGAVIAPWMIRNQRLFGVPGITLRGEMVLWIRTNKLDDPPEKMLAAAVYHLSEYAGHRLFPDAAEDPRDFILDDSHAVYARERQFMAEGLSRIEANRRIGQEAWERIRQHPIAYLGYTPLEMIKLTAFSYVPSLNEAGAIRRFEQLPQGRWRLALVRGVIRVLAYPLLLMAGFGLWAERRQWRRWWPIGVVIVYMNLIHTLLYAEGRYAVPLVPFYLLFAAAGLAAWHPRRSEVLSPALLEEPHAMVR